ncbi:MAG: putative transposase [Hyphomicrobiaceae bacterium]|jgi:putative transposase
MTAETYPLRVLLLTLAGWINVEQQRIIEYLVEENRVLKEQLGGKRVRLNDDQRRRLAAKGKRIGRRLLMQVATIVTPDTILRWHHKLIAAKWSYKTKRVGRPGLMKKIRALIVRFAKENSSWGYCRIQGALKNVGHRVAPSTIAKVLKEHGIKPAPDRPSSWRTFLKAHWGEIAATDFFTTEVWTATGLKTIYVLFFIELKTRRVHVAGMTANPTDWFMGNALDGSLGFLERCRFMIHDRDTKYSLRFRIVMEAAGIRPVKTPLQAPNANAYAERFVRSIKDECLNRMIFFGEEHLRHAIDEYLAHYHGERNHQGLGNELIDGDSEGERRGEVVCHERLGGLLRFYQRAA